MKKISILCFALTIVFTSCTSDNSKPSEASIVGTWKLISDIEDDIEYVQEDDCDVLYIFTESIIAVEEYTGNDCSDIYPDSDGTWPYSIVDNVLIGFDSEEYQGEIINYDYDIMELTETTLRLQSVDEGSVYIIVMERQ